MATPGAEDPQSVLLPPASPEIHQHTKMPWIQMVPCSLASTQLTHAHKNQSKMGVSFLGLLNIEDFSTCNTFAMVLSLGESHPN